MAGRKSKQNEQKLLDEIKHLREENERLKNRQSRLIDPNDSEYRWKQLGGSW